MFGIKFNGNIKRHSIVVTETAASVKACNFTKIRLCQVCFFCELSKKFRNFLLICCKNFLKVHKNTGRKMYAKYLSADDFRKNNNTI